MKISKLVFKNVYGIKEMAFKPGDITILEGVNESGKTRVLDSIKTLFTNQGYRTRIINNGETEAELFAELDDGTVIDRKKRTEKSDFIKVTNGKDVIGSPEGFLKTLFSGNQFNPIKDFINLGPNGQKKVLLSLCNIDFTEEDYALNFGEVPQDYDPDRHVLENLEAIQSKSGYYYTRREQLNRERRAKENVRDEIIEVLPKDYDPDEWRTVVLFDLHLKVTKAQIVNENIEKSEGYIQSVSDKREAIGAKYDLKVKEEDEYAAFKIQKAEKDNKEEWDKVNENIQAQRDKIEEYNRLIIQAENQIKIENQTLDNLQNAFLPMAKRKIEDEKQIKVDELNNQRKTELDTVGENVKTAESYLASHTRIEIEPLQEAAQHAETMKEYIRQADQVAGYNGEIIVLEELSTALTAKIEMARALPGQLLQKAEMPVPGISIENGELLIDNLPLDNHSEGRCMEIALEVAKAKAGELKIVLADGLEKLSTKRREEFLKKAKETGLQWFFTVVGDSEELTIIEL